MYLFTKKYYTHTRLLHITRLGEPFDGSLLKYLKEWQVANEWNNNDYTDSKDSLII